MAHENARSPVTTTPVNIAILKCVITPPSPDSAPLNGEAYDFSGAWQTVCFYQLQVLRKNLEDADTSPALPSKYPSIRAITNLHELQELPTELSKVASQRAKSACRSLFSRNIGACQMGQVINGSHTYVGDMAPASLWPDMKAVIPVVSAAKKVVSSTASVQVTV
ncbi:hypothetical protein B9Z19DRAFT_1134212 [Tuber borchii]|uniref:Uncharacterized protein n=1 Tax=Tuber borchii TaxID=42251 RepID=A0A2T6ZEH8_TUBBO|nr:hypothetical protein B9Z19DRAFT_1134212 [Tuber borchii]